jgi:hypothetical protein
LVNGMLCFAVLCSIMPLAGGIDWAVSIVIYGTIDLTSAFYSQGYGELMCFDAILKVCLYYLV